MKALIVDDERLARKELIKLLEEHPSIEIAGEAMNADEAEKMIEELNPDLLFLDIQMPGMNGFDVLSSIKPSEVPATIFLTAHDDFALAAFNVHALDYLLKPIDEDRFAVALTLASDILKLKKLSALQQGISGLLALEAERRAGPPVKRLVVREQGRDFFVPVEEIEWIEAIGDYAGLHINGRTHLLRQSMTALEAGLDRNKFVRIHRSAIVRLDCVIALRARSNRDGSVQLKNGTELKVSRTYSSELRSALRKQTITGET